MQQVLRLLETRDSVQVTELSEAFAVSEVTVRSDLSELARPGPRRPRPRRRPAAPARTVRARLRPPPSARGRAEAGDRPGGRGDGRRGRGRRARLEHDRLLPRARAPGEAGARRRHERPARSRPPSPTRPASPCSSPAAMLRLPAMSLVGDLGADVLRTTRINKGFLGARGLSLERGLMDLNPDEVRIKREMADACEQVIGILDGTKWHRRALLPFVAAEQRRRDRHGHGRARGGGRGVARTRGRGRRRSSRGRRRAAARRGLRPAAAGPQRGAG